MSNCPLCNLEPSPDPNNRNRKIGLLRRTWRGIQWAFLVTLMVLMPKCPLCVAADIALFSGIGVSFSTAWWIRILMLVFCLISLAYLIFKFCRRHIGSSRTGMAT